MYKIKYLSYAVCDSSGRGWSNDFICFKKTIIIDMNIQQEV